MLSIAVWFAEAAQNRVLGLGDEWRWTLCRPDVQRRGPPEDGDAH